MVEPKKDTRFYGRRRGKGIKTTRQRLIDDLLPRIAFDGKISFGIEPREVWLEIGFGGGEHVAEIAQQNPDVGIVAAEPFINGVASLLAHLNGSHRTPTMHTDLSPGRVDNVRIWPDDIRPVFPQISDGTFRRIYLLYPDPWPKARHANRRFVNAENIPHLYRLLADDGQLFVATDVADYAEWAQEQMDASDLFVQVSPDTRQAPSDWTPTRYEIKGIAAGRIPTYLIFQKKGLTDVKK